MPRLAAWVLSATTAVVACRGGAPPDPPGLGRPADAEQLADTLRQVAAAPPTERATLLGAAVAGACGPACACLGPGPDAGPCPAANATVPAGWPALELAGRYLAEQLARARGPGRDALAGALAALVVPVPRIAPSASLPAATATRPLSVAPVVTLDEVGALTVARPPVVTFGAAGATVSDPPAPAPVTADDLDARLGDLAAELATRPVAPAIDADAATGGLLGDPDTGGFGGLGPSGGTGWGTIGTGRYGTIGGGAAYVMMSYPLVPAPLAAAQPVVAADGRGGASALLDLLEHRGGAIAVRSGERVAELAWSVRAARVLAEPIGTSLARRAGEVSLATDGTPFTTWPTPLTAADRAEIARRLSQLPAAARDPLIVEVEALTVADLVDLIDLATPLAPRLLLVERRLVPSGYGVGAGGAPRTPGGPQAQIGQPQVLGTLDKAIIRRYIKRNIARFIYCYERELLDDATLTGTVTLRFTIDRLGMVRDATATWTSGGPAPEVARCMADVVRRIEFPRPGVGQVEVRYPFALRPAP